MAEQDRLEELEAMAALSLALWRRFFSVQIIMGAGDPMELGRLIDAAAADAYSDKPSVPEARIHRHADELKQHIQSLWED